LTKILRDPQFTIFRLSLGFRWDLVSIERLCTHSHVFF